MSNASSKPDSLKPITDKAPWPGWLGFLVAVLAFIGGQVVASMVLILYPLIAGWSEAQTTDWLDNSLASKFLYLMLTAVTTLSIIYMFVRAYGRKFHILGFRKPKSTDILYALGALPVYIFIFITTAVIVKALVPGLDLDQEQQLGFDGKYSGGQLTLVFASLVLLPAITEETVFRGLLYSSLKKAMPLIAAVLFTSSLFAIGHLPQGGATGPLYIAAIDTFVLSLILIYLREKTDGIWSSMLLHGFKNGIAFFLIFVFHVT